ncbi:hypothetical protein AArcS_1673 [Natranaeroarchaeum sulfidigenes]|uniref:Uncharacterized protein n=1 Tax=Natranaeroarchaeum sulfidigenes TaxID=2784880 RepID=A0A897MV01_9EURY|nr:hypothetical protein AArcS_1673 [Natranaeroarchaeum sulfidigenes]
MSFVFSDTSTTKPPASNSAQSLAKLPLWHSSKPPTDASTFTTTRTARSNSTKPLIQTFNPLIRRSNGTRMHSSTTPTRFEG